MTVIVSSQIAVNNRQIDGRSIIIEQLIDDQGTVYQQSYCAEKSTDINAHLAASVASMNAQFQFEQQQAPILAAQAVAEDQAKLAQDQAVLTAVVAQPIQIGAALGDT